MCFLRAQIAGTVAWVPTCSLITFSARRSRISASRKRMPKRITKLKGDLEEWEISGGEGGIRTPGRSFGPYNGLANRRIQPLCHLSAVFRQALLRTDDDLRNSYPSNSRSIASNEIGEVAKMPRKLRLAVNKTRLATS